jgi:hypothetical protein
MKTPKPNSVRDQALGNARLDELFDHTGLGNLIYFSSFNSLNSKTLE